MRGRGRIDYVLGRVIPDKPRMFHIEGDDTPDALVKEVFSSFPGPSAIETWTYKSLTHNDWVVCIRIHTKDATDQDKRGWFGNRRRYAEHPTPEQIRVQIMEMLDHEVRHWLNMDPHSLKSEESTDG